MLSLSVAYRGVTHCVTVAEDATLAALGAELAAATGAPAESLRLLVAGVTVSLGDTARRPLRDLPLQKRLMLLGPTANELEALRGAGAAEASLRIAPFAHEALVSSLRRGRSLAPPVLPTGPYVFAAFQTLQGALSPPPSASLLLLHRLAADPGIASVLRDHRWRVGLLSEMPPEGKVGVSAVCVLGYNVNAGQEIALRLRTDDLGGFRKYGRIRETLIHELAHMVHSEHDANFKALNSELTREAAAADWGRGTGKRTGDGEVFDAEEEYASDLSVMAVTARLSGQPLGGAALPGTAAQAAAAAAQRRAAVAAAEQAESAMAAEAEAALRDAEAEKGTLVKARA